MNLENQVCSLELSKRLKELGVKQNSLFIWISIIKTGFDFIKLRESFEPDSEGIGAYNYAAYTTAELGEMLPISIWCIKKHKPIFLHCEPANRICHWLVRYGNEFYEEEITEANARAKMLVYLLENNLLELPNE